MQAARPAAVPTLYEGGAFDPEFERTLRITNPGAALRRALTFSPKDHLTNAAWLQAWEAWREQVFDAQLAPALMAVAGHAGHGSAKEILALDQQLHVKLGPEAAERSALAGKRLLRQLAGARGERFLTKLQTWSDAGTLPTHFLTINAVQGALFHLSLRLLLPGYAYWEWTAALQACPPLGTAAPEFAQVIPGLQRTVQTAFAAHTFHAVQAFSPAAAVRAS